MKRSAADVKLRSRPTVQSGSSQRPATEALECFAITAPGLEPICAAELTALNINGVTEEGGVSWTGSPSTLAMANLWLRTASRVIVRAAGFNARTFHELERHARQVPWERFIAPGAPVALRVTCRKSKLYHSGAVEQRLLESIARRLGTAPVPVAADDESDETEQPGGHRASAQLFVVRVAHDRVTISADSSGELLHRRGYRLATAKAPLRETLAAALLLAADWRGDEPLVDPMCGSGTLCIEAASIARRMAPGVSRTFAFLNWPNADLESWHRLVSRARDAQLARAPVAILGSDRDDGAIVAARANAERAGVAADVEWHVQPISALTCPPGSAAHPRGLLVTNPPYGVRVGEATALRNLYAQLGKVARERCDGWRLALLSADARLDRQVGVGFEERFKTSNGGIAVRALVTSPMSASHPSGPSARTASRPDTRRGRSGG